MKTKLLLTCALAAVMVAVGYNEARAETTGSLTWVLTDDGVLIISGNDAMPNYFDYGSNRSNAPWGTHNFTSVIIEEGVTSIGYRAFEDCVGLRTIYIPNSVTSIGVYAFRYCRALDNITIPESVTSIGGGAFYLCTGLKNIAIPNSISTVGVQTFFACSGLKTVSIGASVSTIEDNAFSSCTGLVSIVIPPGVVSIGNSAFSGCSSLNSVTIMAETPPALGVNNFIASNGDRLHVPAMHVPTYVAALPWRTVFASIVRLPGA